MVKCLKIDNKQIDESFGMICQHRHAVVNFELVGKRCFIHNGRMMVPFRVVKQMVGFRFCSFIPFRKPNKGRVVNIKKKK